MTDHFGEALRSMTNEAAVGGAVRHLWDIGFDVKTIKNRLDYPASEELIREIIWKYSLDIGRILLSEPIKGTVRTRTGYIKEVDAYGRSSFRRIEESIDDGSGSVKYAECDFGIRKAKDESAFALYISGLSPEDRTYITDLPWPRQKVWHILDERFERISASLELTLSE